MKKITPENLKPQNTIQKVAVMIFAFTAIVPALFISGFIADLDIEINKIILSIVAAVGTAVAGALWQNDTSKRLIGAITGAVTGLCVLWATYFYTAPRESIIKLELAVPILIGAIPGYLLHCLLTKSQDKGASHGQA